MMGVPFPLMPVPPSCVTLPAMHGDTKQTTSQIIPNAENREGRAVMTQALTVADNDKELSVILSIMGRTLGFPKCNAVPDVSPRCMTRYDWLFQKSVSENPKRERE
jgi:hypothetical protein